MWHEIIFPLCLGLAIFLYGMHLMRGGLERLAENRLQDWILRFTKTPWRGFWTGTFTTALLQSSTAVTVLTIGFVNAGILSFTHSIGIILGTNIGTTVTTQILALKIEDFFIPLLMVGVIMILLPWYTGKQLGWVATGFAGIFWGVEMMQEIAMPLKEMGYLDQLMSLGGNPIVTGVVVGAVITALIHSSSATTAFAMGFYATGAIDLSFAMAIVLGSNVGTCVTGLIAAIQTNTYARRVAFAHLILNIGGVMAFAPLIPWMNQWVPSLSDNLATQVAHVQTIFNVLCSVVMLPFAGQFARLVEWLIPEKRVLAWRSWGR
ncbi:Na/Pi cotransporter family protein [Baia soyae]|uniref:Phosphate:Na+ symporter n=1 Tax=Baia soyae TaxID=1544746 RepID=A0A4R2SE42_9BACL|nr:Na/Pi symporter [Baia soyae]TCP69328.1 phosphate:Na+ symporter [Baia soyae]